MTDQQQTDRLASWLESRRWYGDKSRTITGVTVDYEATDALDAAAVSLQVVRLAYADGADASYLLIQASESPDEDGIESAAVRAWLLNGLVTRRSLEGRPGGILRWRPTSAAEDRDWSAMAGDSRVFRGEQSNTSVVYGDAAMLKLFRKVREGRNPEVEIGEFLTERTRFRAFPRLLGVIELDAGEQTTTIAAIQEFIPSVGDAWSWITERVADEAIRPATIDAARLLGERTAEMHIALATGTGDDFAAEPATANYARSVRDEAAVELKDTISQLERRGVDDAANLAAGIESALDRLLALEGTMVTRMHGDYHLGQVLRTAQDDFAILDFEGEPSRPLSERRAKASPLRDVAGMLRSFDYAAETARRQADTGREGIDAWADAARAAFLDGYRDAVDEDAVLMRGWEPDAWQAALAAFEAHKALYEVRYELSNRPAWLEIPLNALRRIASATSG